LPCKRVAFLFHVLHVNYDFLKFITVNELARELNEPARAS
jgi:hypothetical protein